MSDLARQLIAENKRTKAKFLDLGNCGLTEVPEEIGELVWLEGVTFASEIRWGRESRNEGSLKGALSDIRALSPLAALKRLDLRGTQVSDVGALAGLKALQGLYLSGTQVSDVGPLAGLSALQHLYLGNTQVSDVGPLAGLSALQYLYLSNTQVSDVGPLSTLTSLELLDLRGTPVRDVGPLATLKSLRALDLSNTQVSNVGPLAGLASLEKFGLSHSKVSDISALIPLLRSGLAASWSDAVLGWGICLKGCPLTSPPPEIVDRGNEAILDYFEERRGSVDHLYEAKMLLIGEGEAGKTSLLRRLFRPELPLPGAKDSTKGIEIYRHEFRMKDGRTFRLNVWDFGGQEIYHATHQFFLTRRSLYILVDDTRKDYKSATDEGFKYWLELVEVFGDKSPVLIFQNEKGGRSKAIDLPGIKTRFENVKEKYEGDLRKVVAADKLKQAIEYYVQNLPHIGDELPAAWVRVREEIEARATQVPYISQQEYFEIHSRHLEQFDETKALYLSQYLHDLGVFLHFQEDPTLADTVILQNEWATAAVFRVLDSQGVKARLGRFTMGDCRQLWPEACYRHKHAQLVALMQKFELCYEMRDSQPATWLATQLLPPSKPASLQNWARAGDLVLRYRYDFLPKGMISRLTVRLHRFVRDAEKAWRTGVLFERDGTTVLVELLQPGNEIELRARGPERKDLLCVVAADLDALNETFEGLRDKVDKQIPCSCTVCSRAKAPQFYPQKRLLKRKHDGQMRIQCDESYADVDVLELLDGVRITQGEAAALRTVRIFLASSSELRADRDEFERYFLGRNKDFKRDGFEVEFARWEEFLDAVSATRLQDEYNKKIRECDICLCLFATKVGKFTEEEFDAAYGQFKAKGRPRVWTYFKDVTQTISKVRKEDMQSVWAFQERLEKLGHFYTQYSDIEHLKRQFRDQLEMWLKGGGRAAGV